MSSPDKELGEQLFKAGNQLLQPPASVDELLALLDQVESCLSRVEQSPSESMQDALSPSLKALVTNELLRHSDADVKVAVASCISEITRITAPEAPYDDDQMKDVFQLIVSSFEGLSDNSSRSFRKRTSILETVAKVRSCVVMLDLECDALILEMFQHFLKTIREYHPINVFSSMETIMTLVLEESEDISADLLYPILDCVRRDNKDVLPIARSLVEKVLKNCGVKLGPIVIPVMKSLDLSLADYTEVVAGIYKETSGPVEENDLDVSGQHLVVESELAGVSSDEVPKEPAEAGCLGDARHVVDNSPKSIMSNGLLEALVDKDIVDSDRPEQSFVTKDLKNVDQEGQSGNDCLDLGKIVVPEKKSEPGQFEQSPITDKECNESLNMKKSSSKELSGSSHEDSSIEAIVPAEKKCETGLEPASPKAIESDTVNVASSSPANSLSDGTHSIKVRSPKTDNMAQQSTPSANVSSEKAPEEPKDSQVKSKKRSRRKTSARISNEDSVPVKVDGPKEEGLDVSDSEAKLLESGEQVETINETDDRSAKKKNENKKPVQRKANSMKNEAKSTAKVDVKGAVSSPKSAGKFSKGKGYLEKTPMTNSKGKRSIGKEKASNGKDYNEALVGSKVKVWWPFDRMFYEGVVGSFDPIKKRHKVLYTDGDEEILNLQKERWELIEGDSDSDEEQETSYASPDEETEKHQKKKARTRSSSSVGKAAPEASPRKRISTSKYATAALNSGRKSKYHSVTDSKGKDGSKTVGKSETESAGKATDDSSKTGMESTDHASKKKGKSKNVDTPKSKNETLKSATKNKGKSSSGGKKTKSGSSKVKENEEPKEKSPDLPRSEESLKRKLTDSSEGQHTKGKTGSKRRKGVRG